MSIKQVMEEYRVQEKGLRWTGTFDDYFAMVVANPKLARLSHARMHDMIVGDGYTERDGARSYNFFAGDLYGVDKILQKLTDEYFGSAAKRMETRKRILLFMGPVGGGKSTIVTLLKRGLERYTKTDDGAVYAIKGCPMHEEPLHLIPEELRPKILEQQGLYIEGDLCPHCRLALVEEYDGRAEDVPVERIMFSEKNRVGIGTFSPSDPKSQDVSELTGSLNLATIGDYGTESDPRAYRFDGELNIANRGAMEFIEMLKCLSGDTLLYTEGGICRLDSFGSVGQQAEMSNPIDVNLATLTGLEKATHIYRAGVKATKKLTTERGFTQEGACTHRVLIIDRNGAQVWRRHDELLVGDWLVLQKGQNLWATDVTLNIPESNRDDRATNVTLPRSMSPELARWLGYMVSEGDTQESGNIRFRNGDSELLADWARLTEQLFGISPKPFFKGLHFGSVRVLDLMKYIGWTTGSYSKVIPWAVLQSSRESALSFLSGYFAGDGSVGTHGRLWWTSASRELVHEIQILLLNLGVVSRMVPDARLVNGVNQTYWKGMADGEQADALAGQMTILPEWKREAYFIRSRATSRSAHRDFIPNTAGYWRTISDDLQRVVINKSAVVGGSGYRSRTGARQLLEKDYASLHAYRTGDQICTRQKAASVLHRIDGIVDVPTGLTTLLNPSLFYDRIVTVEDGSAECWDLHVPGSNTYIANGIVGHNCDEKFLYGLLTLSQEQNIKTGRFAMIYADEVVLSHTNENEFNAFASNKRSEALHDRMVIVKVPYNLRLSEEVKIYEKLIRQSGISGVHIAPNTLKVASMFAILTRLEESKKAGMTLLKKLKLYNGEDVDGYTATSLKELTDETTREGMDGLSPRYVINCLSSAVSGGAACVNPIDAMRALRDGLDHHMGINREYKERCMALLAETRTEFDDWAKTEVQRAFVHSFEDSARRYMDNYMDNAEAYCRQTKLKDPITGDDIEPDEKLMRSIEEQIGISDGAKKVFREEVLIHISAMLRKGKKIDYNDHARLKDAIEKKLFSDMKDIVKITTSSKNPDPEQQKRVADVVDKLVSDHGYCRECANALLQYVGTLLGR